MAQLKFWTGILLALASACSFGLIPLFATPLILSGIAPETVALYRFGLASIILYPTFKFMNIRMKIGARQLGTLALLALCYFLDVQFFFYAFQYLASGLVATLEFLAPVLVMAIMFFFFHQKFHWQAGLAALIALPGVWLLSGGMDTEMWELANSDSLTHSAAMGKGIMLSLLAALFYALYLTGCETSSANLLHPLLLTFYIMLFGTLYCLVTALWTDSVVMPGTLPDIARAVLLAVVTAIFSNLTLVMAIKRAGSVLTSIMGVMEPLTALVIGICVFDEKLSLWMAIGALMVTGAATIAPLGKR